MIVNRIVTRGFGPSRDIAGRAGPITRGYGGVLQIVAPAVERAIRRGKSGDKRYLDELEEVIVWAKLIEINNMPPKKKIEGSVRVRVDSKTNVSVTAENVRSRVRNALDKIKVTIKRIK